MSAQNSKPDHLVLLVATRKGAWLYHGDAARQSTERLLEHELCGR